MHISNHFVTVCNIRNFIQIYKLNDLNFELLPEDFVRKLEEPQFIFCEKNSGELSFLGILSTNKLFYYYCYFMFI